MFHKYWTASYLSYFNYLLMILELLKSYYPFGNSRRANSQLATCWIPIQILQEIDGNSFMQSFPSYFFSFISCFRIDWCVGSYNIWIVIATIKYLTSFHHVIMRYPLYYLLLFYLIKFYCVKHNAQEAIRLIELWLIMMLGSNKLKLMRRLLHEFSLKKAGHAYWC